MFISRYTYYILLCLFATLLSSACAFPVGRSLRNKHATPLAPLSSTATGTTDAEQSFTSPATTAVDDLDGPVILFDGVCNFCNTWVDILLRVDVNRRFKFAPLQSDLGQKLLVAVGKESNDISSVVLVQPPNEAEAAAYYDKSACVLKVVEELGPVAQVASHAVTRLLPQSFRDSIYDTVAENRYNLMGKRDECRCGDPKYADRFLS